MGIRPTDSDVAAALRTFGLRLSTLRREAAVPVGALAGNGGIPVGRTQLYEILGGRVQTPPSWDLVQALVQHCRRHAAARQRVLSVPVDLAYWRREHGFLVQLCDRARAEEDPTAVPAGRTLTVQGIYRGPVSPAAAGPPAYLGVVTGDIRQVRCADVWVNPENTDMIMARPQEFSVSAIIRYDGARRDEAGRITVDTIADELEKKVAPIRPVAPGTAIVTGAGELRQRNGVRYIVHTATVHGEPGTGFHPVRGIARCVENVLLELDGLDLDLPERSCVLFPLLGTGVGRGDVREHAGALTHSAANYLRSARRSRIGTVLFLAYTDLELQACLAALGEAGVVVRA
ncbi:macro domain-containing protein [Catellatospora aurea]|uniref:Macro domain-containing protein n=1 Tax=Catellatospora aurea TaxID=1337874 RepID=A0ABW2H1P9_9ACTN